MYNYSIIFFNELFINIDSFFCRWWGTKREEGKEGSAVFLDKEVSPVFLDKEGLPVDHTILAFTCLKSIETLE